MFQIVRIVHTVPAEEEQSNSISGETLHFISFRAARIRICIVDIVRYNG